MRQRQQPGQQQQQQVGATKRTQPPAPDSDTGRTTPAKRARGMELKEQDPTDSDSPSTSAGATTGTIAATTTTTSSATRGQPARAQARSAVQQRQAARTKQNVQRPGPGHGHGHAGKATAAGGATHKRPAGPPAAPAAKATAKPPATPSGHPAEGEADGPSTQRLWVGAAAATAAHPHDPVQDLRLRAVGPAGGGQQQQPAAGHTCSWCSDTSTTRWYRRQGGEGRVCCACYQYHKKHGAYSDDRAQAVAAGLLSGLRGLKVVQRESHGQRCGLTCGWCGCHAPKLLPAEGLRVCYACHGYHARNASFCDLRRAAIAAGHPDTRSYQHALKAVQPPQCTWCAATDTCQWHTVGGQTACHTCYNYHQVHGAFHAMRRASKCLDSLGQTAPPQQQRTSNSTTGGVWGRVRAPRLHVHPLGACGAPPCPALRRAGPGPAAAGGACAAAPRAPPEGPGAGAAAAAGGPPADNQQGGAVGQGLDASSGHAGGQPAQAAMACSERQQRLAQRRRQAQQPAGQCFLGAGAAGGHSGGLIAHARHGGGQRQGTGPHAEQGQGHEAPLRYTVGPAWSAQAHAPAEPAGCAGGGDGEVPTAAGFSQLLQGVAGAGGSAAAGPVQPLHEAAAGNGSAAAAHTAPAAQGDGRQQPRAHSALDPGRGAAAWPAHGGAVGAAVGDPLAAPTCQVAEEQAGLAPGLQLGQEGQGQQPLVCCGGVNAAAPSIDSPAGCSGNGSASDGGGNGGDTAGIHAAASGLQGMPCFGHGDYAPALEQPTSNTLQAAHAGSLMHAPAVEQQRWAALGGPTRNAQQAADVYEPEQGAMPASEPQQPRQQVRQRIASACPDLDSGTPQGPLEVQGQIGSDDVAAASKGPLLQQQQWQQQGQQQQQDQGHVAPAEGVIDADADAALDAAAQRLVLVVQAQLGGQQQQQIEALTQGLAALQGQLQAQAAQHLEQLQAQAMQHQEQQGALMQQVAALREQADEQEKRHQEQQAALRQALEVQAASQRQQVEGLQRELADSQAEHDALQEQLQAAQRDLRAERAAGAQAREQQGVLMQEVAALREQVAAQLDKLQQTQRRQLEDRRAVVVQQAQAQGAQQAALRQVAALSRQVDAQQQRHQMEQEQQQQALQRQQEGQRAALRQAVQALEAQAAGQRQQLEAVQRELAALRFQQRGEAPAVLHQ